MYGVFAYKNTGNLGDAVQTVALTRLLPGKCFSIYRDSPLPVMSDGTLFIANGWLGKCAPQEDGNCVFAGVHISSSELDWINRMRDCKVPIGARDPYTGSLLTACNTPHVMVGCATLTFDRYVGPRKGRYCVDVKRRPGTTFLTNDIGDISWADQWMLALQRLQQLRTAELVYTNRLHVILPCLAFGTPVIFPLADLHSVCAKERLTILSSLGFVYDEEVVLDVSNFANNYRHFLSDLLCRPCKDSCETPECPALPPLYMSGVERPKVSVTDRQPADPTVFYLRSPRHTSSFLHEQCNHHVEVLNQHGRNAYSVSLHANTTTPAAESNSIDLNRAARLYDPKRDYILLSGELSNVDRDNLLFDWPGKKVLLGVELSPQIIMEARDNLAGVFTLSESTKTLLNLANPALPVFQIEYRDRLSRPSCGVPRHKDCIIAIAGNILDCPRDIRLLGHVLNTRTSLGLNSLRTFRWELLDGLSDEEIKPILEQAPIVFCSPTLEQPWLVSDAKAYGCLVLGYGGTHPIAVSDQIVHLHTFRFEDIVAFIENALSKYPSWPPELATEVTNDGISSQSPDNAHLREYIWNAWDKIFQQMNSGHARLSD